MESKDSESRAEYKTKVYFCFYSRGASYLRFLKAKIAKAERNTK